MGSNSSTGGGGGGKTEFGYTKPKRKFVPPSIAILKGLTEGVTKFAKESNLKRRKKFISKSGLTSDDINMSDEYLSSKEGLAELKKQGYTTVSDNINDGGGNDNNNNQVVQAPDATTMPVEQLPEEVKVAEMTAEEARAKASDLIKKKRKNTGRSKTILTSAQGVTDDKGLTLGKKSLLG